MKNELEFIRGNQKNFIRLCLEEEMLHTYEYQMCMHNSIKSFLPFQKRTQNGQPYLYYDMTGTQSLDIVGQTQKLDRDFMVLFAKELLKLCQNIKEYMLSLGCVVLDVKWIMYKAATQEVLFVYAFKEISGTQDVWNDLLEFCVEYLDYSDRQLSDCVFRLCEHLQEQGENFSLEAELEQFLTVLDASELQGNVEMVMPGVQTIEPFEVVIPEEKISLGEDVFGKADKKEKRGILLLLCADVIGILLWKPFTILKGCFFLSFGLCLAGLYVYISRKEKAEREKQKEQINLQEKTYINEYETIAAQCGDEEGTQFIAIAYMSGVLYNLQGITPQYISISETRQLIGKDKEKVQVCIDAEGISRVHASIIRKGQDCILEDLCSTNGTYVNGKNIGARVPYVLKEGDHICFANVEYSFR